MKKKKTTTQKPAISKKLQEYLEKNKYKYEIIGHRTTYTAWDTAQTEKVKPQEVAKALVMKADKEWIVAVLPSNRNVNKKDLLAAVNKYAEAKVKKLDFADEKWLKKNITIGKLGALPPFRQLLGKEVYFDKMLLKNKKFYVSGGEYTSSLRISTSQYTKLEKPILAKFSVKKP